MRRNLFTVYVLKRLKIKLHVSIPNHGQYFFQSKEEGNYQQSIQSSTKPDP